MRTIVAIAIFGTLGCLARYGQILLVQQIAGRAFPFAVLSINVIGSFLIGLLFFSSLERFSIGPAIRIGILTGFLGGYTTFSTFELETLLLVENGQMLRAALYIGSSVGLGLIAVLAGAALARSL